MKSTHYPPNQDSCHTRHSTKRMTTGLALALALGLFNQEADAVLLAVNLGSAADFAVLAGAGITVAAPVDSTVITGDIGTFATTTITGLENTILFGVNHAGDSNTQQAKIELGSAYTDAAGRMADELFPLIHDIGGATLVSGVYNAPSSLGITGMLTLDGGGDSNAVWIFQTGSTLITASGSSVNLINGAQAGNIFWQVGSSATLGVGSDFEGSILAHDSITLTTNATMTGRALALGGAVTLDSNTITIPESSSSMLLALGLSATTLTWRRKS
jgi:Ice-binding-like